MHKATLPLQGAYGEVLMTSIIDDLAYYNPGMTFIFMSAGNSVPEQKNISFATMARAINPCACGITQAVERG